MSVTSMVMEAFQLRTVTMNRIGMMRAQSFELYTESMFQEKRQVYGQPDIAYGGYKRKKL